MKNKIPNITNLATTADLTTVENKIRNVSNLVEKTDYNTKRIEIKNKITTDHDHDKYITTQEFNKLTLEHFTARLAQANLASKKDIANFVKGQVLIINQIKMNQMNYQEKLKQYQQKD